MESSTPQPSLPSQSPSPAAVAPATAPADTFEAEINLTYEHTAPAAGSKTLMALVNLADAEINPSAPTTATTAVTAVARALHTCTTTAPTATEPESKDSAALEPPPAPSAAPAPYAPTAVSPVLTAESHVLETLPATGSVNIGVISDNLDLRQIYPSPTNNLEFRTYQDLPEKQHLSSCLPYPIPLTSSAHILLAMASILMAIMFAGMAALALTAPWFFTFDSFGFFLSLIGMKAYLLFQTRGFIKNWSEKSLQFHEYGMRMYYALCADLCVSAMMSLAWVCEMYFVHKVLHEEDDQITRDLAGFFGFPLFVYTIVGSLVVLKLPQYFDMVAYRKFCVTEDTKYCVYDHHSRRPPVKQGCLCCGGCTCQSCGSRAKCGLRAISVWAICMSVLFLLGVVSGVSLMTIGVERGDDKLFFSGLCDFVASGLSVYMHASCAVYGIKQTGARRPDAFHKYTRLALFHFSVLSGVYWVIFVGAVLELLAMAQEHVGIWIGLSLLTASFGYLPFEGLKLVDSNVKMGIFLARRNAQNAADKKAEALAYDMETIDVGAAAARAENTSVGSGVGAIASPSGRMVVEEQDDEDVVSGVPVVEVDVAMKRNVESLDDLNEAVEVKSSDE